jgi:hypothetical protein
MTALHRPSHNRNHHPRDLYELYPPLLRLVPLPARRRHNCRPGLLLPHPEQHHAAPGHLHDHVPHQHKQDGVQSTLVLGPVLHHGRNGLCSGGSGHVSVPAHLLERVSLLCRHRGPGGHGCSACSTCDRAGEAG